MHQTTGTDQLWLYLPRFSTPLPGLPSPRIEANGTTTKQQQDCMSTVKGTECIFCCTVGYPMSRDWELREMWRSTLRTFSFSDVRISGCSSGGLIHARENNTLYGNCYAPSPFPKPIFRWQIKPWRGNQALEVICSNRHSWCTPDPEVRMYTSYSYSYLRLSNVERAMFSSSTLTCIVTSSEDQDRFSNASCLIDVIREYVILSKVLKDISFQFRDFLSKPPAVSKCCFFPSFFLFPNGRRDLPKKKNEMKSFVLQCPMALFRLQKTTFSPSIPPPSLPLSLSSSFFLFLSLPLPSLSRVRTC